MDVCVVGLGKLGLPLAVQIAQMGHRVHGADISERVVDLVNSGVEPFPGETELDRRLAEVVAGGQLIATTQTCDAVAQSQAVIIIVPLLVNSDREPVFDALDSATEAVAAGLQPGTLVSYETTLPVGTTRNRFTPRLVELSGLTAGEDLYVVHSPERVFTGRVFSDLRRYPKLVGGVDAASTKAGVEFYEAVLEFDERPDLARTNGVWAMSSVETAELTKLAETTYRNVNIGLANEFARYAERSGIDVYDVIEAANSQVFSHIHQPGASVGGHCIPVYPHFYLLNDGDAQIPRRGVEANEAVPAHLADTLNEMLPNGVAGQKVAVLGLSYRAGVKELAFSGTFPLVQRLAELGARPVVDDPMYLPEEIQNHGLMPVGDRSDVGALILHTAHAEYESLTGADFPQATAVVDGRDFLDASAFPDAQVHVFGRASDFS